MSQRMADKRMEAVDRMKITLSHDSQRPQVVPKGWHDADVAVRKRVIKEAHSGNFQPMKAYFQLSVDPQDVPEGLSPSYVVEAIWIGVEENFNGLENEDLEDWLFSVAAGVLRSLRVNPLDLLVGRLTPTIRNAAHSLGRSKQDFDDRCQDGWVTIFENFGKIDWSINYFGYVYKTVRNRGLDHKNKASTKQEKLATTSENSDVNGISETILDGAADPTPTPLDQSLKAELRRLISNALSGLSHKGREIIALRYGLKDGGEHTLKEIGQKFNCTAENVRQIENRIFWQLRQNSDVVEAHEILNGLGFVPKKEQQAHSRK